MILIAIIILAVFGLGVACGTFRIRRRVRSGWLVIGRRIYQCRDAGSKIR